MNFFSKIVSFSTMILAKSHKNLQKLCVILDLHSHGNQGAEQVSLETGLPTEPSLPWGSTQNFQFAGWMDLDLTLKYSMWSPKYCFIFLVVDGHKVKELVFHIERYILYDPVFHISYDVDHRNPRHITEISFWIFMEFISNPLALMHLTKTLKVLGTFRISSDQCEVL